LNDLKLKKLLGFIKVLKIRIYNILENETSPYKQIYDIIALFIVITSSIAVFSDITPQWKNKLPPDLDKFLDDYEIFALYFFLVEYILRWWVISNFTNDFLKGFESDLSLPFYKRLLNGLKSAFIPKIKWMISFYAIIDLISILPLFRPLRAFRILRVLRILKIIRYGGALKSLFSALKEQSFLFAFIFSFIATLLLTLSLIVYIYEYNAGNSAFNNMWQAIYWGIITVSTVGYGDITPITPEGKFLTSFLVLGGIVLVSALTGTFSAALVGRLIDIKGGELKLENLENHIVICGWNETAEEIVEQLISIGLEKEKGIVIITNLPKSEIGIKLPDYIGYKRGDFIHENVLLDVGVDKASDIIIVAEREEGLSERNIDARTALAAMVISTINPDANIYVEVLLDEDADIFKKRMKVKEVIIHGQLIGKILFSGILNPGTPELIKAFIDREAGIKKVKISKLGKFENFGELLIAMREKGKLPIAIERKGVIKLNPEDNFILKENDYVFLI
jgi:voltage-gated potassium channel